MGRKTNTKTKGSRRPQTPKGHDTQGKGRPTTRTEGKWN